MRIGLHHPLVYVNLIFFVFVCIQFWLISLFTQTTWLIDPYWTIVPPLVTYYYALHPLKGLVDETRVSVTCGLIVFWALSLTYSYFRREEWMLGAREDWRFADMRKKNPTLFSFTSFFLAYVSQQPMLLGITLPIWAVNFGADAMRPFNMLDIIAFTGCILSIILARVADYQLRNFMVANEKRAKN